MGIDFSKVDWNKKLVAAGIDSNCLKLNKAGPCPLCFDGTRGGKRFRFDNKGGMGTWYCQQCGAGNGYTLIERYTGMSKVEILKHLDDGSCGVSSETPIKRFTFEDTDFSPEQVKKNRCKLIEVSAGSIQLTGNDPVSLYLRKRVPGCDLSKISQDIRIHPGLKFFQEGDGGRFINRGTFPTMVARAIDAAGRPITLHRTYLTSKGDKAPLDDPKKQMKGIRKLDGAAIRVVDVPESRTLGLAEGIETSIAVATGYRYGINVWSMLNCVNLSLADIPEGRFDKIIIFADHDLFDTKKGYRPGEHFAEKLKERLEAKGYEVEVRIPKEEGTDFADVWLSISDQQQQTTQPAANPPAPARPSMQPQPLARPQSPAYA
jgi:putative DNA primase/helicase